MGSTTPGAEGTVPEEPKGRRRSYEDALYHANKNKRHHHSAKAVLQKLRDIELRGTWPTIIYSAIEGWWVIEDDDRCAAIATRRRFAWWHIFDPLFDHLMVIAVIAVALAITSVGWAVCPFLVDTSLKEHSIEWLAAFWTIAPAGYFFLEFHWARETKSGKEFRDVKESQKVAQKVWAGVVVALAVLYLKHPVEGHAPDQSTKDQPNLQNFIGERTR
jgi:hypothetical protein